jgi:hypothetical protein
VSFLLIKKKKFEIEKKIFLFFVFFVYVFVNSLIKNLFIFIFFIFELNFSITFILLFAFLNLKKCEFIQKEKKKFFDEKFLIKSNVSNLCKMSNSSFLSLNKFYVENIKIEEKRKKKRNFFDFEFFVIDFLFDCR